MCIFISFIYFERNKFNRIFLMTLTVIRLLIKSLETHRIGSLMIKINSCKC